ncbi:helix-turn-helix transcriptional regulator [Cellulosimicrobium protaetiae]|uniref:WYL domain-containing protein n=1 Tax=Cellulosimicrobium protaetiae TaxID=2587808 RepID=A0A6M5UDY1_9MICO|nr:WYL domain-containing protein [Cellulosimicrobium protaetiae]QJW36797.1 WYL domain-containing protein [Cellulosimicrobium protaetiae]
MSEPTPPFSAPPAASSSGSSSTNPAARLLNLVIALVNTNASMTKQQIRISVAGYGDAPSPDAFERMFERDKDTLRDLGIPIVTVDAGGHADEVGYRIDQDAYALPAVDLTPAELGVLALAAQFWQDKTLRTDISRALTKLRAAGAGETAMDVVAGLAPQVRPVGDAYATLMDAISARRAVSFTYRAASTGEVRARRAQPWRIAARRGGWYLVGLDLDRGAPRSYRLSRVEGRVRATGPRDAFEVPVDVDVDAALGTRDAGGVARLAVVPERAGALRARGTLVGSVPDARAGDGAGRDVLEVAYDVRYALADEVVGYGDAVLVLGPPDLREAVVRRLRDAAALGSGSEQGEGSTEEAGRG